jgi:hypothetical protein
VGWAEVQESPLSIPLLRGIATEWINSLPMRTVGASRAILSTRSSTCSLVWAMTMTGSSPRAISVAARTTRVDLPALTGSAEVRHLAGGKAFRRVARFDLPQRVEHFVDRSRCDA